ncbi:MAG: bifunctional diaminohydroxyphosphoribosylaminopyrimidine deaminase/5-amino-6-(5-phosphoribosylamino)uracil reductase RibD [Actinobacteria bacterium]|nr:bifunctional diaminohydroxyphosphoribosylaminopyrimidine deaminase/5-amino-6-(5-phosphoribosylamino)uracil reductase RibD [Actinomycetota bacterium]
MNAKKDIFTEQDKKFMEIAFRQAEKGRGTTSPNPMVGAVIVKDGNIISMGYHKLAGTSHAEINAINSAKTVLEGAKMYVTLEPCTFYGKTPPCVNEIIKNKFSEVIISSLDPNPKINGRGARILKKVGIIVKTGLLKEKAEIQNEIFFTHIRLKRPFICAKIASSIDGKLAAASGDSKWMTGIKSRNAVQKLRFEYGCVLTGIGTIMRDDPFLYPRKDVSEEVSLNKQHEFKKSIITKNIFIEDLSNKNIKTKYEYSRFFRIILDSNLKIGIDANIVKTAKYIKTVIFISQKTQKSSLNSNKIKELSLKGIDIIAVKICGSTPVKKNLSANLNNDNNPICSNHDADIIFKNKQYDCLDLNEVLKCLYDKYEITSVLLETGPALAASFLQEKLIDKFMIFLAPKIIGGSKFEAFSNLYVENMKDAIKLRFEKIKRIGEDLLMEAYPEN